MKSALVAIKKFETAASCFLLVLLAAIPCAEMIARVFFKTGIPDSGALTNQLVLVVGMLAGMIATREKEHLSISFKQFIKSERAGRAVETWTTFLSVTVLTVFAIASFSFVRLSFSPWKPIALIPDALYALVLPLGYLVIAVRFMRRSTLSGAGKYVHLAAFALGVFLASPALAKIFWGFETPGAFIAVSDAITAAYDAFALPLVLAMIVSAFLGAPLFVVLGAIAMIFLQRSGSELEVIPNQAYTMLTGANIPAIPLFTLAGFILSESRATHRLVHVFKNLFGWLPGGMIMASVLVCAFFTTFTGGSGVTILALGGLLSAILVGKDKYPKSFTTGLLTAVGSIGLLFPPSLPIILVGAMTQTNIMWMFMGGLVPGIILVLSMLGAGVWASYRYKVPVEKFDLRKTLSSLKGAVWELLLPVFIVVGYFSGTFSLLETAGLTVIYTIAIELFVNKDFSPRELPGIIMKAIPIIGGVLMIIASAQMLSYYIVDAQIPNALVDMVRARIDSPIVFLLILNVALLVTGCLMDIYSAILVVMPLIAPLGLAYGIHPVHLGIIFIINMEVGFLTPPVGLNLFLASYRFKRPFLEVCRDVLPFLAIQMAVVLLVTFVPFITTGILSLVQ
ncbi:MAG: TRAP transporter large permease subunit [Spirochaetes bacterium]|nr:TRAP transporter large permease subunit [Spirochaetota bacterium]